ncbi:MAG TPA: heparan-alpha-glucosaminide N-acetyltransferase domain-containing protein [Roseiflexaceae bacterium]|nr:heparan-alpha-glucosaminide N-acetyltransferase domain-containing protein [Roseiflexaceae bacterium]HMP39253.1 heparan-alpha-glucosaminide N-acetyltransferase domain-containing protein [Roseiflexaceae bacterium]
MTTNAVPIADTSVRVGTRTGSAGRIVAVDALRGAALVLMALTHAAFFIGVGMQAESYGGQPVFLQSGAYVVSGLLTTLASPIFFCLAGVSLALYEAGKRRKQATEWEITRFIVIRALIVIVLDLTLCNWFWLGKTPYVHVLTTMGLAMIVLAGLRHLPTRLIGIVAVALLLAYQGVLHLLAPQLLAGEQQSLLQALFLTYSYDTRPAIGFPLFGWAPVVLLGFVLGRAMERPALRAPRTWLAIGGGLLVLWLGLRLIGSYGDLGRFDAAQGWMHFFVMSKAPPSLSYLAFKLGIAALLIALLYAQSHWVSEGPLRMLATIGQTSLFFYVAHILVYNLLAQIMFMISLPQLPGIIYGYAIWLAGMLLLVPLAYGYRTLRRRNPQSLLRYL